MSTFFSEIPINSAGNGSFRGYFFSPDISVVVFAYVSIHANTKSHCMNKLVCNTQCKCYLVDALNASYYISNIF